MDAKDKELRFKEMAEQFRAHKANGGDVFTFKFVEPELDHVHQAKPPKAKG